MPLLDGLIAFIRGPFDWVWSKIYGVKSMKDGFVGDVKRLHSTVGEMHGAAKDGVGQAKGAVGGAQGATAGAQGQAQAAGAAAQEKKGMFGLFSKKKKCPSCGQKLHASWDVCPYCGYGEKSPQAAVAAPVASAPAAKQRTMAIDMSKEAVSRSTSAGVGWLVPLEGQQQGEVLQVKGRTVVGTASECDLVLQDPSISSRHCEFIAGQNGFRLTDLGSTNGTFVNEKRIQSEELIDNDIVKLGRTSFKFKAMI